MRNLEKAADLILRNVTRGCEGCYSPFGPCVDCEDDAADAAKALADAGLLAPDLPEPSRGMGSGGAIWYLPGPIGDIRRMGDHIVVFGHDHRPFRLVLTESETETIAHALLAAANYDEGHQ